MDLIKARPGVLPRINIESDPSISSNGSGNHLSLGRVRDALACSKCRLCQKMEFHCRHCKHRCHKKCPGHMHRCVKKSGRRSGSSKIYTGDEHWTKVLQANEVINEITSCPYHGRSRRGTDCSSDHPSPDWDCPQSTLRPPPPSSRSSSSSKDPSSPSSSTSSASSATATANSIKDKTFLHTIYSRFCQWIDSARKDSSSLSRLHRSTGGSPRNPSRRSSFGGDGKASPVSVADDIAFDLALLVDKAASVGGGEHYQRTVSSSDSELGSAGASYSSTCSSLTVTSTSTTTSDCCPSCGGGASSAQMSDCSNLDDGFLSDDVTVGVCAHCSGGAACPSVRELASAASAEARGLGWPRTLADENGRTEDNWYATSLDREDLDERDGFDDIHISYYEEYLRDSLIDWSIPISDVELLKSLRKGVKHEVFRGRWHGDVFIYCFNGSSELDMAKFLREVTRLSKIRHENICLFMGACLQPPKLAVITSELKGISVYEKLHLSSDRIPMRSRVNIGRQVAQAMGYLHAKGITAQILNSRNIYLEPKVKLSLLDQGMAEMEIARPNEICIPRGSLTYLAPEILRDLRVKSTSSATCTYLSTVHTDVFAFGTLFYELFSGQFPFRGLRLEEILWQVCSANRQTLVNISCNTVLKVLIERCWASTPEDRPQFSEINQELQQKTGLHKRHSSSQPERLDRQNSFTDKCLL